MIRLQCIILTGKVSRTVTHFSIKSSEKFIKNNLNFEKRFRKNSKIAQPALYWWQVNFKHQVSLNRYNSIFFFWHVQILIYMAANCESFAQICWVEQVFSHFVCGLVTTTMTRGYCQQIRERCVMVTVCWVSDSIFASKTCRRSYYAGTM